MDIRDAAQIIRDTVSMEDVLALYGYQARNGFMVCPFHADKGPSLKIYRNRGGHSGWHCFGCGEGGSVIDFVMVHDGCDFRTAVMALDRALGLQLGTIGHPLEQVYYQQERRLIEAIWAVYDDACAEAIDWLDASITWMLHRVWELEDMPEDWMTGDMIQELINLRQMMQEYDIEIAQWRAFREEVSAWRRRQRANRAQKAASTSPRDSLRAAARAAG